MNSEDPHDSYDIEIELADDLAEALKHAIDDWVLANEIQVHRIEGTIIADEEELIEKVAVMVALTAEGIDD
ncbi:hypothetical protein HYG81_21520 (plasmid) [Natrinema zhouii]|uniref:hypothetical protein n=1 Tax=Natrinema zhouii TaxID=1710539 RepID=UPI001CFF61C6|nr:hypothetical protein [Natrinema zhouii]UHQ98157.1 hypothetical protein HYG81_21520 [Natrinema zhouii]